MGSGKTTVITPLLALFCASNSSLFVQTVPKPLLQRIELAIFENVYRKSTF